VGRYFAPCDWRRVCQCSARRTHRMRSQCAEDGSGNPAVPPGREPCPRRWYCRPTGDVTKAAENGAAFSAMTPLLRNPVITGKTFCGKRASSSTSSPTLPRPSPLVPMHSDAPRNGATVHGMSRTVHGGAQFVFGRAAGTNRAAPRCRGAYFSLARCLRPWQGAQRGVRAASRMTGQLSLSLNPIG